MISTRHFSDGDVVGFRRSGLNKTEHAILETEGVIKYGWGPFRVKGTVEDRNGRQLHIDTNFGKDALLPTAWFIPWE